MLARNQIVCIHRAEGVLYQKLLHIMLTRCPHGLDVRAGDCLLDVLLQASQHLISCLQHIKPLHQLAHDRFIWPQLTHKRALSHAHRNFKVCTARH